MDSKIAPLPDRSLEMTRFLVLAAFGMLVVETFVAARASGTARP
jgi:hypothetical protein